MRKLVINRCPEHGFYAISLDCERGGTRITHGKCCGRWETVKSWDLDAKQLRSIANEFECNAEELEEELDDALDA